MGDDSDLKTKYASIRVMSATTATSAASAVTAVPVGYTSSIHGGFQYADFRDKHDYEQWRATQRNQGDLPTMDEWQEIMDQQIRDGWITLD